MKILTSHAKTKKGNDVTEPTTVVASTTYTVGSFAFAGSMMGMPYEGMLFGLIGGVLFVSFYTPETHTKLVATLAGSALIAGLGGPVTAGVLTNTDAFARVNPTAIERLSALILGGVWLVLLPILLKKAENWTKPPQSKPSSCKHSE